MPQTTQYALAAAGGAYTSITPPFPCRYVEIREDEAAAPVGLQFKRPEDAFTQVYVVGTPGAPDVPQLELGNKLTIYGAGTGPVLGYPMQNGGAAYNGGTTYGVGTVVVSAGLAYISIQAGNTGNTPASSPLWWTQVRNYRPADVILQIQSKTAGVTKINVTFHE